MPSLPCDCCCLLTPNGRGAVATIGLFSKDLEGLLGTLFSPANGRPFKQNSDRKIIYGTWVAGTDDHQKGEGLVVCPINDNAVEIHCHGGTAAVENIVATLHQKQVTTVEPAEYHQRLCGTAFHQPNNKTTESIRTELLAAVANASTNVTAQHLLRLLNHLASWLERLSQTILAGDVSLAATTVQDSIDHWPLGKRLTQPFSAVFCGEPNVGKSSLINHLAGFERTIVHSTAGTTRDVVSWSTAIAGWPVTFADTAGLRSDAGAIEKEGIERARATIETADLVIAVFDISSLPNDLSIISTRPDLIVFNKTDLVTQEFVDGVKSERIPYVCTSIAEQSGLEQLLNELATLVVPNVERLPLFIPINERQTSWLRTLLEHCEQGGQADALSHLRSGYARQM